MRLIGILHLATLLTAAVAHAAPNAVIVPSQDTWVSEASSGPTPGWFATTLQVGPGEAFLRFDLPRNAAIRAATLTGEMTSGGGSFVLSRIEDDDWTDRTLRWGARPAVSGDSFATLAPPLTARFAVDVTEIAQAEQLADGVLGIHVRALGGGDAGRFGSRESAGRSFRLELEIDALPGLATGDIVLVEPGPDVWAVTPGSDLRRLVASVARFAERPQSIGIDPRDGSWVVYDPCDADGPLFRVDPADGSPSRVSSVIDPACSVSSATAAVAGNGEIYFTRRVGAGELLRLDPDANGVPVVLATGFDGCVAIESETSLVLCEENGIARVDRETGARAVLASGALLTAPYRVAVGADAIWVLQPFEAAPLVRVDRATGAQSEAPGAPPLVQEAVELADGTLFVASSVLHPAHEDAVDLGVYDPTDGTARPLGLKPHTTVHGLALLPDATVVAVFDDPRAGAYVSVVDPADGAERVVAAPLARDGVFLPGVIVDARRRLVVVAEDRVVRIDLTDRTQETLLADRYRRDASAPWAWRGGSVFADRDGSLLVTEMLPPPLFGTRIRSLGPDDTWHTVLATPATVQAAVLEDADHFIGAETRWVAGAGGSMRPEPHLWRIRRSDGAASEIELDPTLGMGGVDDLLLDRSGVLYLASWFSPAVVRMDLQTGASEWLGGSVGYAFAQSPAGLLYLRSHLGVTEIDPETALERAFVGYPILEPFGAIASVLPRCSDGWDNDGDGAIDFPADAACASREQDREGGRACGLGMEIAFLTGAVGALARSTRTRRRPALAR